MSEQNTLIFEEIYAEPSKNGLTRPKSVRGEGYKMVNMGELFANPRIDASVEMERVKMSATEIAKYTLTEGDLLFARQSLVAEGAGKCSIINTFDEPTTFESHLIRVRLDKSKANPWFYYYYFQSYIGKNKTQSLVNQVAAAGIRGSELAKLEIDFPDKSIQDKIASICSLYDNLIKNNNRRIAILEEMAQRLYREWFVHFRFPGHENAPMVESELGMIPEGWRVSDLESCCSIIRRGISPKYNDNAAGIVINQKCIRDFSINLQLARHQEKAFSAELQVHCGDVLINSTGVGTLGRVAQMYMLVPNCTIDTHVTLLRPNESITYYVGSYLREKQDAIMDMGVGSTGQTELSRDKIKSLQLAIPDGETLSKYEKLIADWMSLKIKLQNKNVILRETRDHLLPRLLSGDIDASKIEI